MAEELASVASQLLTHSMVGLARLKSFTGKCSWCAGVIPRMRWAVAILYAVLTSAEHDLISGVETVRRQKHMSMLCGMVLNTTCIDN